MKTSSLNDSTVGGNRAQDKKRRLYSRGNNPPKEKKPNPYPGDKTLWAYWMQGIEPTDQVINQVFPEYHPLWVQMSQRKKISGVQFKFFRQQLLRITQAQCAAYLRVKLYQVRQWEQEQAPVPFMAVELLRLVYESVTFKLSHPKWDGWFIDNDGRLVSPDRGSLSFVPSELSCIREIYQFKANTDAENKRLRAEVASLKQDIAEMQSFIDGGALVGELNSMRSQLESILANIGTTTAKIYKFPSFETKRKEAIA